MTGPHESAYGRDLRVVWPGEDWAEGCLAYLPDPHDNISDRGVMVAGGGCVVRGWTDPDATLLDPADMYRQKPQIFSTVDEAIAAVIGEPYVSVLTVEEIAAARAAGMPVPAMVECRVFFRRDLETGQPKEVVAWVVWQGGWHELHTWPWNRDGVLAAGQWGLEHAALRSDGYPVRTADELLFGLQ